MAMVLGVLLFESASGETRHHGSCVSAMIDDKLRENSGGLGRYGSYRLTKLRNSIYEGIHRTGILIGRHVDEAKMVLAVSEPCDQSHARDGLVCAIYSVFGWSSLQIYADEDGIVFKTTIVPL